MNILGLVFPASFLQQSDHHQNSECNGSLSKCSAVNYIARTFRSRTKESPQGVEFVENCMPNASVKEISNFSEGLSRCSSNMNTSAGLASSTTLDEPTRRNSKKKKRKKGKLNKVISDNAYPETADFTFLACPSIQNSSEEISCQTGMIKSDLSSAMTSCKLHKDNPVQCDSTSSLCTLNSEGSKHMSNSDDVGSLSSINKLNSRNGLSQDSTFGQNKFTKVRNKKFARKQDRSAETFPRSAIVRSVTGTERKNEYLRDGRCCETGLPTTLPSHDDSNLPENDFPPQRGDHISHVSCRNDSNRRSERSNVSQDTLIAHNNDHVIKRNPEATLTSSSIPCIEDSTINSRFPTGGKEVVRDGTNEDVQSSNQFSIVIDNPTVASRQDIKYDVGHSKTSNGTSQIASCVSNHKQPGKENTHLVWQKTGKNVGGFQSSGKKRCNSKELCTHGSSNTTSKRKQNNVKGDGLLETLQLSYIGRKGLQRIDNLEISDHVVLGTHRQVLVVSPEWVVQEKIHAELGSGNMPRERLKDELNQPLKQENLNNCKRGSWISKTNLSNPRSKSDVVLTDALEDSRTKNLKKSNIAGQRWTSGTHHHKSYYCGMHELRYVPSLQPHAVENIPPTEDLSGDAHDPLGENNISPACFTNGLSYINSVREYARPRESLHKWIPVGKKCYSAVETNRDIDPCTREARQETDCFAVCAAVNNMDDSNCMKHLNLPRDGYAQLNHLGEGQNDHSASNCKPINLPAYDYSDMTLQALNAAYIVQITSERVQLTTGSPITKFEKFLDSASPIIVSYVLQNCEGIIGCQPILNPFSKFHGCNVSICDVWNWYERPGSYGLEVKAKSYQNLEQSETDDVSFSAYFVPFLSAVQLFGRSDHTCVRDNLGDLSPDMQEREKSDECCYSSSQNASCPDFVADMSASDLTSAEQPFWKFDSVTSDRNSCLNSTSAQSSYDSKVIFEYFEHEPPQQRKPLYSKIKELVETGTSNPQVFGDPSKLECMNLQDLHPASWYSVAWYPIYRIPEGSLRASFLTYHSLGHLVLRPLGSYSVKENAFSVVSPVVGMQSYNAQSEGWFDLKKPAKSSWKDDVHVHASSTVKRLRSLKETAGLFARGLVHKDHIDVLNRHPDYEFFLSRKQ